MPLPNGQSEDAFMTASPALDYLDYAVAKACDCVAAGNLAREQDKAVDVPARHNPLVVVGPSGCGKSQWLKNFFHLWRKRSTEKAGLWDGLALGAEIAAAAEADTLDRWRSRFVSLPLVLIDGIDRVADSHSQQLLPFLFDAAASAGKQWVVTLRAHPHVCTTPGIQTAQPPSQRPGIAAVASAQGGAASRDRHHGAALRPHPRRSNGPLATPGHSARTGHGDGAGPTAHRPKPVGNR